jgi:hypothetical protein
MIFVMKPTAPIKLQKKDIIQKIAGIVTFSGPIRRLGLWLEHKLKIDLYELRGDEVVSVRHRTQRFNVPDVRTWQQVFICFGVPLIVINFADERTVELSDKHEHLIRILQQVAPEKELPWKAI